MYINKFYQIFIIFNKIHFSAFIYMQNNLKVMYINVTYNKICQNLLTNSTSNLIH